MIEALHREGIQAPRVEWILIEVGIPTPDQARDRTYCCLGIQTR